MAMSKRPILLAAAALAACHTSIICPQGETACGDRCVDLLTSAGNCGQCGAPVGKLEVCRAGLATCAPGVATCDGACTDLARDPAHCGDCATACDPGTFCTTEGGTTRCEAACPEGFTPCGGACVDLQSDRLNCSACGVACTAGQQCRAGTCGAEVQVACYATGDVRPLTADLEPAGDARLVDGSPSVVLAGADAIYAGNSYPGGVAVLPLDERLPLHVTSLAGNDIEGLAQAGGLVLASNAAVNTLALLDPQGVVVGELLLPGTAPNPHGLAVLDGNAYVALYGDGPGGYSGATVTTGQAVAVVALSDLTACTAPPTTTCDDQHACASGDCVDGWCRTPCGSVIGTVDLLGVAGAADPGAYPFPSQVAAHGGKVYVTLSNLVRTDCGGGFYGYCKPAGSGRLAVIDPAAGNAVSIVDLGASCKNPGAIAFHGDTAWIACGSFSFQDLAPGALLPVDVSGKAPVVRTAVDASAVVPGGLAICGDLGYVTDQASGAVMRFDATTGLPEAPTTVCPTAYFAWAADVACP
jgi:hypothetical protein